MSLLQYKYKAHRLINTLFYVIVFVIGFVLGFGAKEIDFNKLISQVLMIDNVKAEENLEWTKNIDYGSYTSYYINLNDHYDELLEISNDDNFYKEKYIYDLFNFTMNIANLDFKFIDYSNVLVTRFNINYKEYLFRFSKTEFKGTLSVPVSYSDLIEIRIVPSKNEFIIINYKYDEDYDISLNDPILGTTGSPSGTIHYTNSSVISGANSLDFSNYSVDLTFNENLFKDNPDFKEVCVDSSRYFAVSSDSFLYDDTIFSDFLWFSYGLYGLYQASYNAKEHKILYTEKESSTYHYYFSHKDVIDEEFTEDGLQYLLSILSYYSYENRYSYYGWTAYPFSVSYSDAHTSIPVYYFENPITYSSIGNNIHGGSGTRLEFDDELEESLEYCFYIRNNFHVVYIEVDEFGDFYGDIITPNGNLHIDSTNNKDNISSGGLMSQVNNFIKQIKDTLNFIRENIYNFYLSMPLLLRMFLISIFVILIVKFIIGMVVK